MKLAELKKEPRVITGDVRVERDETSLDYGNTIVQGAFNCSGGAITSLKGSPQRVGKTYSCSNTNITSLKGCTQWIGQSFFCYHNNVRSLVGAPRWVGRDFNIDTLPLTSLKGIHRIVEYIGNHLEIPNSINSHILGLLKIRGLILVYTGHHATEQDLHHALAIINTHLELGENPTQRDIHKAQEELIEAGLARFAQL